MKRIICLMLLVMYASLNLGLVINIHYCSGKIASVSLYDSSSEGCSACARKQAAKKCCEDTQTSLSVSDDHLHAKLNPVQPDFSSAVAFLPSSFYTVFNPVLISEDLAIVPDEVSETGPPKTPIYIQIRSLII